MEIGARGARLGPEDAALVRPRAGEAVGVEPLGDVLCYFVLLRREGTG